MKKIMFLLPGAIAVILASTPVAPIFIPSANAAPAQAGKGWMSQLNLSDTQKVEIKKVRESARQQMETVLTQTQKDQLKLAKQNRQRPNLNLTDDQKAKMQAIREDSQRQIKALLTPDQQQQYDQLRQQRQQRQQQRLGM